MCILQFPKKLDLGIIKNYNGIIPTAINGKVHNALLLNSIWPEVEIMLRKKKRISEKLINNFLDQPFRRIIKRGHAKNLEATPLFGDFS